MPGQQRKKIIQDARDAISTYNPSKMLPSIVDIGLQCVEENKELLVQQKTEQRRCFPDSTEHACEILCHIAILAA